MQTAFNKINAILLGVIAAGGGVLLWHEGYLPRLNLPFLLFGAVVFSAAFWFAAFDLVGDVTVGESPSTDSMAAAQWRQNRLSSAFSREQVGHLTMKGMLSEHADKIDR